LGICRAEREYAGRRDERDPLHFHSIHLSGLFTSTGDRPWSSTLRARP
jgi:hypothetical protein